MSGYDSREDRRSESAPAEARSVTVTLERANFARLDACLWCRRPVIQHSPEALTLCEHAFQSAISRRLHGPTRLGDIA